MNIELNCSTHCGVFDFTGEENHCYLPLHMFNRLCLTEGMKINLRNVYLEKGRFIKFKPHLTEFIMNPNPKVILENGLRSYVCITKKDTITIQFNKKKYLIDVVECKPKDTICLTNVDIEVDFETPIDYVEPPKIQKKVSNVVMNEEKAALTEKDLLEKIQCEKFKGNCIRVDGKKINEKQALSIESFVKRKNVEDTYDPRKHRITHGLRQSFVPFMGHAEKVGKPGKQVK